ncbi:MAG: hypothetical protein HDT20_08735 [Oscillibacter sp.]|nr:hypothetical protein [Oscillibacter sp.]
MKNLKNRILSGVMSGILAVSLVVPAFAATEAPKNQTTITGSYEEIVIDVSVPTTGTAQLNPYGLPVALDGTSKIVGEQIVSKPMFLLNNTDSNLKVSAAVTATAKGDLKLAAAAPAASDVTKSAHVYLQMKATELDDSSKATSSAITAGTDIQKLDAATANAAFAAWNQAFSATTDLVLVNDKTVEKANMVTLGASDVTVSGSGESATTTVTYNKGSIAMFRLAGTAVADPKEAWTAKDGFSAVVAFTFKPDTTTATLSGTANIAASGNTTLTVALSDSTLTITSVKWTSATTASATVANATTTAATNQINHGGTAGKSVITAEVTASNGVTYTATLEVTAA